LAGDEAVVSPSPALALVSPNSPSPAALRAAVEAAPGIDHAMAGGVYLRRIGLHTDLVAIVEHHHATEPTGDPPWCASPTCARSV
jgi:hypothetical protein